MYAPMPPHAARLETLPWELPEWGLLRDLQENVLKGRFADISTSSPTPGSRPKKELPPSRAAMNQLARDLNAEMRQVLTVTNWAHLEAVLNPEEPTTDDRARRSSFQGALVQVCEFLDGLVDTKLRAPARGRSPRYHNLKSLHTSLRGRSQNIECLTKRHQLVSIFTLQGCDISRLYAGLKHLKTFNNLVCELHDLDLPLASPGLMPGTLGNEAIEKFTRHATSSLGAIFDNFCGDKGVHNVLVELPAVANLAGTTNTLGLLISLCNLGGDLWQEAEVNGDTNDDKPGEDDQVCVAT